MILSYDLVIITNWNLLSVRDFHQLEQRLPETWESRLLSGPTTHLVRRLLYPWHQLLQALKAFLHPRNIHSIEEKSEAVWLPYYIHYLVANKTGTKRDQLKVGERNEVWLTHFHVYGALCYALSTPVSDFFLLLVFHSLRRPSRPACWAFDSRSWRLVWCVSDRGRRSWFN